MQRQLVALVALALLWAAHVHARPLEAETVVLEWAPGMEPSGTGMQQGKLSTSTPASVRRPPSGGNLLWGDVELAGRRYPFAVEPPASPNDSATLYVDRNGDGDLTNDDPERYAGTGERRSAARVKFDVPSIPYVAWLFTNLGAPQPSFGVYALTHRRGKLALPGGPPIPVYVGDDHSDGTFRAERITVDWDQNGRVEKIDRLQVGDSCFLRGRVVRLMGYDARAGKVTFKVSSASSPPPGTVNAEAFLAGEPQVGKMPPPLDVPDLDGRAISLSDYRGRLVLVDFWATWCGPCLAELPNVEALYARYHANGLEVIGVSLDSDLNALRAFVKEKNMPWRQACDAMGWKSTIAERWHVQGIPATFLIGRDGTIVALNARGRHLESLVEQHLKKSK